MQEQLPYKTTPEQGWARMAVILDKELPLHQKPRRLGIFWWNAAAAAIILILGAISFFNQQKQPASVALNAPTKSQFEQATVSGNTQVMESETLNPAESSEISGSEYIADQSRHPMNGFKAFYGKGKATGTPQPYFPSHFHMVSSPFESGQDLNHGQVASNEITTLGTHACGIKQMENPVPLDFSIASLKVNDREVNVYTTPSVVVSKSKKNKMISPYISGGLMASYFDGASVNVAGGLSIDVFPGLRVNADIGPGFYSRRLPKLGSNRSADTTSGEPDPVQNNLESEGIGPYLPGDFIKLSSNNTISPYIRSIQHWQVQLGLTYDLTRRFFVEGGALVTFGTSAKTEYPIVEFDFTDPYTGGFNNVGTSLDSYKKFDKSMVSLHAGIGYRPFNNTELFIKWNHGLNSYEDDTLSANPYNPVDVSKDYIRGLHVGLRQFIAGP